MPVEMCQKHPDFDLVRDSDKVDEAVRRAVRHALLEHKRAGNPVASREKGRVVIIPPEDIPVEGPTTTMGKFEKLLNQVLRGTPDANIQFDDLRRLLLRLGFEERTRGSHHMFRRQGVEDKINLQRDDGKAKPYQVKQVRAVILKYKLGGES
jgi:hypothetical protein